MSQAWLITGANRGIGLELVKIVSSHNVVFAATRNLAKATELEQLASHNPNIHVIKLESTSVADATAAARLIDTVVGGLDVVVSNAGIANDWNRVTDVSVESLTEHFNVNAVGALILFQAMYPLLLKRQTRKFITVSTIAASLQLRIDVPHTVYGTSKVALNFITRSIHNEHSGEGFIAFPIHPGMVNTDMGQSAAPLFGLERMALTPEQSAMDVFKVIDKATSEQSGRFLSYDGTYLDW